MQAWKVIKLVLILIMLVGPAGLKGNMGMAEDATGEEGVLALTEHGPIKIDGDADLDNQAAAEGWPGDGSSGNPYVIGNYIIKSDDGSIPLDIRNIKDRYLLVANCTILNDGSSQIDYAVSLKNIYEYSYSFRLKLVNVTVSSTSDSDDFKIGIYSYNASFSIKYSSIYADATGIYTEPENGRSLTAYVFNVTIGAQGVSGNPDTGMDGSTTEMLIYGSHIHAGKYGIFERTSYAQILSTEIEIPSDGTSAIEVRKYGTSTDSSLRIDRGVLHGGNFGIYTELPKVTLLRTSIDDSEVGVNVTWSYISSGTYCSANIQNNTINSYREGISVGADAITETARIDVLENMVSGGEMADIEVLNIEGGHVKMEGNTMERSGILLSGQDMSALEISGSNTVNGRPVFFMKDVDEGPAPPPGMGQYIFYNVSHSALRNISISGCNHPVLIYHSDNLTVRDVSIDDTDIHGVYLYGSENCVITRNHIRAPDVVYIDGGSSNNRIYLNEFFGNATEKDGNNNFWSDYKGNYWDYWARTHEDSDGDGIIDEPCPVQNSDEYDLAPLASSPLISPPASAVLDAMSGDGYVRLSWTEPDSGGAGITEYRIYRGTDINSMELRATTISPDYNDSSVENGKTYYYYITAVNPAGEGSASNVIVAEPAGLPGAPLSLTYGLDGRELTLTWAPPSDDGGSAIMEYRVYRDGQLIFRASAGRTYFRDTIEYGVGYEYHVSAVNSLGEGESSMNISVRAVNVPDAPQDLLGTVDNGSLYLSWREPSDNGEPITEYRIYRNGTLIATRDSGTPNITFTSKISGIYWVTAVNSVGESEESNPMQVSYERLYVPATSLPEENGTGSEHEVQDNGSASGDVVPENGTDEGSGEGQSSGNSTGEASENEPVPVEVTVNGYDSTMLNMAILLEAAILGLLVYQVVSPGKKSEGRETEDRTGKREEE